MSRITPNSFTIADFTTGIQTNYTATGPEVSFVLAGDTPGTTGAVHLSTTTVIASKTLNSINVKTFDAQTFKGVPAATTTAVEVYLGTSVTPFASATFNPGDTTANNIISSVEINSGDQLTAYLTEGSSFVPNTKLIITLT